MNEFKLIRCSSLLLLSGLLLAGCGIDDPVESEPVDEEVTAPEGNADSGDGTDVDTDSENMDDADVETNTGNQPDVSQDLLTWFPQYQDTLLEFEGFGNKFSAFTRYPQFVTELTMQVVDSTGGTEVVRVFEYTNREIREIFTRGETYFRDNVMQTGLNSLSEKDTVLLQLPIETGHSWENGSGSRSEITDTEATFETDFHTFTAIEVTRYDEDSTTLYYFAEEIGLVKEVFKPSENTDEEITSTLVARHENQPENIRMLLFSLNEQADNLLYQDVSFGLFTNEEVSMKLTELFRNESEEASIFPLISSNTVINRMYLRNDGIAAVDFSRELITEMNAGAGVESLILQAIVNTIGRYYDAEDVLLTVDGQPYASGHIELSEGEIISVDYEEGLTK